MNNFSFTLKDDFNTWQQLLPLTFVRSISECRVGILTLKEKWEKRLNTTVSLQFCVDYLQSNNTSISSDFIINSSIFPTDELIDSILNLPPNSVLEKNGVFIASNKSDINSLKIEFKEDVSFLRFPWDIFLLSDRETRIDFDLLTKGRTSQTIDSSNKVLGTEIFLEEGASVQCAILNSKTGPIYLGKSAEIMEGSIVRGPFSLGEKSQLKLGTKIYGATNIGPQCKVGGEISNSVIFGYSNKAHDGFIGNSVIAEWCNLGADTNSSNLKNNYSLVDIYSYKNNEYISTEQQFCGLIMGDYSKSGINTMFNTGTVVGVCANIFGAGFPSKHIPSFSWCSIENIELYKIEKALETIQKVYERRGLSLDQRTVEILTKLFENNEERAV